jgi:hypothetical protein
MKFTSPVIPIKQQFIGKTTTLNYEAICVFIATGFFLDTDTYYKEQQVLQPARHYELDINSQNILSETPYFKWHYAPKERSFDSVVTEFGDLFESVIKEQTQGKQVILPLSGGLDSRTQAVALKRIDAKVQAYGYTFDGGHDETLYGKQIAQICNFPFESLTVQSGYLWDCIEQLATINGCYSEFTHPRQMAFIDRYPNYGDVFSLGHWGDVLFDDMGVDDTMSMEAQVDILFKKVVKKSGFELAKRLWKEWGMEGDFMDYIKQRFYKLLQKVDIPESANAQIRAFKSMYWAPRWTSVNLSVFETARPVLLPYYDHRMCEFICSVPERYLAGRQIQIAYIKQRMPTLAKLTWQAQRPFNLYNYRLNTLPWNLPYRVINKLQRTLTTKPYIQRNFELQFLGANNDLALRKWLFSNPSLNALVPKTVVTDVYTSFKTVDMVGYSHAVSMLLTLSLFTHLNTVKN